MTAPPYDATKVNAANGLGGLAFSFAAITPSDSTDLTSYASIHVTVAGNLAVIPALNDDAEVLTYTAVPVGFEPPFAVRRVKAAGTTATVVRKGKVY